MSSSTSCHIWPGVTTEDADAPKRLLHFAALHFTFEGDVISALGCHHFGVGPTVDDPEQLQVPEYDRLYSLERKACLQRFAFHLKKGEEACPSEPEVVMDRAVYLGYRGGYQNFWGRLIILSGIPLIFLNYINGPFHPYAVVIGMLLIVIPTSFGFVRVYQSHRLHPNYRRYNIFVDKQDWSLGGTVGPQREVGSR